MPDSQAPLATPPQSALEALGQTSPQSPIAKRPVNATVPLTAMPHLLAKFGPPPAATPAQPEAPAPPAPAPPPPQPAAPSPLAVTTDPRDLPGPPPTAPSGPAAAARAPAVEPAFSMIGTTPDPDVPVPPPPSFSGAALAATFPEGAPSPPLTGGPAIRWRGGRSAVRGARSSAGPRGPRRGAPHSSVGAAAADSPGVTRPCAPGGRRDPGDRCLVRPAPGGALRGLRASGPSVSPTGRRDVQSVRRAGRRARERDPLRAGAAGRRESVRSAGAARQPTVRPKRQPPTPIRPKRQPPTPTLRRRRRPRTPTPRRSRRQPPRTRTRNPSNPRAPMRRVRSETPSRSSPPAPTTTRRLAAAWASNPRPRTGRRPRSSRAYGQQQPGLWATAACFSGKKHWLWRSSRPMGNSSRPMGTATTTPPNRGTAAPRRRMARSCQA